MKVPRRFLIVDDNADSRFLLVKTLVRKFPHAAIDECHDSGAALTLAAMEPLTAIVAHRTYDDDGLTLIGRLRGVNARVPIVMVSGIDRSRAALAAGANAFLLYDEWLRIGTVVSELIAGDADEDPLQAESTAPG